MEEKATQRDRGAKDRRLEERLAKIEEKIDRLQDEFAKSTASTITSTKALVEAENSYWRGITSRLVDLFKKGRSADRVSDYRSLGVGLLAIYISLGIAGISLILSSGLGDPQITRYVQMAQGIIFFAMACVIYFVVFRRLAKKVEALELEAKDENAGIDTADEGET
jgi:hypothetical protein